MKLLRTNIFSAQNFLFRNNYAHVFNSLHNKKNFTTDNGKNDNTKKKRPNGLQIDCEIKSPLKEFLNADTASRVFVLKYAWKYIKDNNLQNPNMKRKIIPDDKLKQVLDKDEVDILEVPKLLFKHMSSIRKE
ncbi:SWIB/MDM2 domain-containing protein, putative [Plasmodium reichenowi]|uniref:SWIB/MDM2 domain-containing protein, putative n=1 Tax=Plasmodium reichenowi TaxID=5854 RepID=A0A2P9D6Y6_PLARE|nr:SWIB/MDM2 domain-containing protein, putative [Plasmodium reichenowi]